MSTNETRESVFESLGNECTRCGHRSGSGTGASLSVRMKTVDGGTTGRPPGQNYHQFFSAVQTSITRKTGKYTLWCMNCVFDYNAMEEVKEAVVAAVAKPCLVWVTGEERGWKESTSEARPFLENSVAKRNIDIAVMCGADPRVFKYRGDGEVLGETLEAFCQQQGLIYRKLSAGDSDLNLLVPKPQQEIPTVDMRSEKHRNKVLQVLPRLLGAVERLDGFEWHEVSVTPAEAEHLLAEVLWEFKSVLKEIKA